MLQFIIQDSHKVLIETHGTRFPKREKKYQNISQMNTDNVFGFPEKLVRNSVVVLLNSWRRIIGCSSIRGHLPLGIQISSLSLSLNGFSTTKHGITGRGCVAIDSATTSHHPPETLD